MKLMKRWDFQKLKNILYTLGVLAGHILYDFLKDIFTIYTYTHHVGPLQRENGAMVTFD